MSEAQLIARLRAAGCVFAEDEARLLVDAAPDPTVREALVARRVAGEPLEHVVGWAEFCGLRVAVAPGVFVPRRRSEFLVDVARRHARGGPVVDLCCGGGAIGLAIVTARRGLELYAADIDPAAVACAQRNLDPVGGRVFCGDLVEPLPAGLRGRVDLLVVNAPYVPTDEIDFMPADARNHEPRMSLDGGPDGLDVHRRVAALAADWLVPGGHLLIETSARQADRTAGAMRDGGLVARILRRDEATVALGRRPVRAS